MTAEELLALPPAARAAWLKALRKDKAEALEWDWSFWQRSDQVLPAMHWRTCLVMAGRGYGKTRMGAEWVRGLAEADPSARIGLVAATLAEARMIMVEGESGLLSIAPPDLRPTYEPSLRRLRWPNGAEATLHGAAEPDSLRGHQHSHGWADEIAKWEKGEETWDNLMLTLRLGARPQAMATTTPRPVPLVRRLLVEPGVARTGGATAANAANLPRGWLAGLRDVYGQSRLARQELEGELIEDVEGALFPRDLLDRARVDAVPELARVVVGVDPPASSGGDACGIVVAGVSADGRVFVLADASVRGASPEGWARAVAQAAASWNADRVIAEANQGGDMVLATLRAADVALPVKKVHASRGKVARAEPVAALFEAGRAFLAGHFPLLEDELAGLCSGGRYEGPGRSPDRADACVWALSELVTGVRAGGPRVRVV